MVDKNYDFCGWATRNDLICSDGRVIRQNAFKDNDGGVVPLVWNHQHGDPLNVLGHALLENRDEGVYAYGYLNNTASGITAKEMLQHGDITMLSIYANGLKQKGADVMHGVIREVSLVLAGANPEARIESVLAHGEDSDEDGVIYTGEEIYIAHSDEYDEDPEDEENDNDPEDEENVDENEEEPEEDSDLEHSDDLEDEDKSMKKDRTIGDVIDTMNEEQRNALIYLLSDQADKSTEEGENDMKHNGFEGGNNQDELMHSAEAAIIGDAKRYGSLKESFLAHADEYGITNIDYLAPEFQNINGNGAPEFLKRRPDAWVEIVMNGVHRSPFAKVKMLFADIREDEARAKGYMKGKLKREEVFSLLRRTVEPTTIYKKQKFDRDDIVDVNTFDVIGWVKAEMRTMLDEEIARAILFGDGRSALSDDKISETNIIPAYNDQDLYTIKKEITPAQGESLGHAVINGMVKAQDDYEGSGNITAFLAATMASDMLLLEDADGHRLYKGLDELALAMGVEKIVKVPASIIPNGVYVLALDLKDYNLGADKGGAINMFDDFDIDYNQQKYLIETRCSGALTRPFSAIVLKAAE